MRIRTAVLNIVFTLLAALGLLLALFGVGADILPGSYPGLNLSQLLLIAAGLLLSLLAFRLRHADARHSVGAALRKHWRASLLISLITLLALELVLTMGGVPTYYPPHVQEAALEEPPWWACDELGCRFVQNEMTAACENGEMDGRYCIVNRQGFHDAQDFMVGDDFDERLRILTLGDSFTFGSSADIGKSYVETIEANLPRAIVWNTGIPGSGTQQSLPTFQAYAPLLQPQITLLGFYLNDFKENIMPLQNRIWWWNGRLVRQALIDSWGNVRRLDPHSFHYYHTYHAAAPANEIQRLIGLTRLGSLALKTDEILRAAADPIGLAATGGYLRALRDAAAAQNTALLTLLIPTRHDLAAAGQYYQAAAQLMKELEMPYLDPRLLLDEALDYAPRPDGHWSSAGHQKIGAMLTACVKAFQIHGGLSDCAPVIMPPSAPTE